MKKLLAFFIFILLAKFATAQTLADDVAAFRKNYKEDFIREARSPLKAKDTGFLRFYPVDVNFAVWASLQLTPDAPTFDMLTHSGKKQVYRQYAIATFVLNTKAYKLCIYQSMNLIKNVEHQFHLFLPFNDLTNYETTYAGGRYIDLESTNIQHGKIWIDFNKAYNPYCAFKDGYSCPIPPTENRLKIRIEAGEQLFAGTVEE